MATLTMGGVPQATPVQDKAITFWVPASPVQDSNTTGAGTRRALVSRVTFPIAFTSNRRKTTSNSAEDLQIQPKRDDAWCVTRRSTWGHPVTRVIPAGSLP